MAYPHTYRTKHSETHTTNAEYGAYYANRKAFKIPVEDGLKQMLHYCDANVKDFINDLAEAVLIKSISENVAYRKDLLSMIKLAEEWLTKLEIKYECFNVGFIELDGQKQKIPPVILATCGNDPQKRTVCVYSHLDVKDPCDKPWSTCPWVLTQVEKKLFGCGVASGKGPLICWFHAIESFKATGTEMPVNIKFIIEAMNHQESQGLAVFLKSKKLDFFAPVDFIVSCDGEWIGEKIPCITYGTVGLLHFDLFAEQTPTTKDVRQDLNQIVEKMYNKDTDEILIPHFNDFVKQITPDEELVYERIKEFDPADLRNSLPLQKQGWKKCKLLMHFWRLSSMYASKIQECVCEIKDFSKVKRQLLVKIVPHQIMDESIENVIKFIEDTVKELNIQSIITCNCIRATRPWIENISSPNYRAAERATIQVYKELPNYIREDTDRKSLTILYTALEKNILFLPLASKGSNIGEANENINVRNFLEGTKLLIAYILQLAEVTLEEIPAF